jgi:hypothetical protein
LGLAETAAENGSRGYTGHTFQAWTKYYGLYKIL